MGDLDISKLKNLANLKNLELSQNDFQKKDDKEIFSIFDGGTWNSDGKLGAEELNNIFGKLQKADTSGDGKLSSSELRKAGFKRGSINEVKHFISELINKVESKVAEQTKEAAKAEAAAAEKAAKEKAAELEAEKGALKEFKELTQETIDGKANPKYREDIAKNDEFKGNLASLEAELAKDEPDMKEVGKYKAALQAIIENAEKAKAEPKKEAKPAAERAAYNRAGKVSYHDTTNRIGARAWKHSVGELFGEGEGKLKLADYSTAEEVLNAILGTDAYKDLKLSDAAKKTLLKDFIHNNKSMFNEDGKIHDKADISRLELPSKADIEKAKYDQKPSAPRAAAPKVESEAAKGKRMTAQLAARYTEAEFKQTDGEYSDALKAKVTNDLKNNRIPGYRYDAESGKVIKPDNTMVEIEDILSDAIGKVNTAVTAAKTKKTEDSEKAKNKALGQRYKTAEFKQVGGNYKKELKDKVTDDLKNNRIPGYRFDKTTGKVIVAATNKLEDIEDILNDAIQKVKDADEAFEAGEYDE